MAYKEYFVSYSPTFKRAADLSTVYYYQGNSDGYFAVCALGEYLYMSNIGISSDITDFIIEYVPTGMELPSQDDAIAYAIINESFSQKKYDMQATVMYIGNAQSGVLSSEAKWTIKKFSMDADGNLTAQTTTRAYSAIWDNRASETYY